jgi:N-acetylmuramic acid 6-phosphate (MurNAc-6-P) etherase
VRRALEYARSIGAATGLVACSPPPQDTLDVVDILILPITGPEVVTGSTRMKAGTATKMVLNMITTGAMIRLGKTYGNLMVDLRASNNKLIDRSERILMEVCEVDRAHARQLLDASGGIVKTAIVMHFLHIPRDEAERALEDGSGVIRRPSAARRQPRPRERLRRAHVRHVARRDFGGRRPVRICDRSRRAADRPSGRAARLRAPRFRLDRVHIAAA